MRVLLAYLALATLGFGTGACKRKIGDPCRKSVECNRLGGRACDLSYRVDPEGRSGFDRSKERGECIVDGCTYGSCPDSSTCVKVYGSDFLAVACDPAREDIATIRDTPEPGCVADPQHAERFVCPPLNLCEANEVCLAEGLCADEVTARTSCRRSCKRQSDCRKGYRCASTGANGVYLAPNPRRLGEMQQAKICVPDPMTGSDPGPSTGTDGVSTGGTSLTGGTTWKDIPTTTGTDGITTTAVTGTDATMGDGTTGP